MKAKRISVTALKRKYPHPRRARDAGGILQEYCVGGALCKAVGMFERTFPDAGIIKEALAKANPHINELCLRDEDPAWLYDKISALTAQNDAGNFTKAWATLGELLRWKPTGAAR